MMKPWLALVIGMLICSPVSLVSVPSYGAAAAARTSDADGVKVVVTPKVMSPTTPIWEFEIVLDTHTKPLNEDLTKKAVLVDNAGRRYLPDAWQGDAGGGHHRKGILRFAAPTQLPAAVELQLHDVGGTAIRTFRWELK